MKQLTIIILVLLLSTLISCTSEIQLKKYIDPNTPLTLLVKTNNKQTMLTTIDSKVIAPKSEQFEKLISWSNNNTSGWHSTPATCSTNITVTQNDFRLSFAQDFVIVGFIDNKGKAHQYSKKVKKGELDFLMAK
jgi:hypothetical protein